jgi:hypothetical protein
VSGIRDTKTAKPFVGLIVYILQEREGHSAVMTIKEEKGMSYAAVKYLSRNSSILANIVEVILAFGDVP